MCAVLEAVEEGFIFVGGTELATEVPYGIVILQGQLTQKVVQFLEAVADFRWVGFVGFCVGLVKLIQDGIAFAPLAHDKVKSPSKLVMEPVEVP